MEEWLGKSIIILCTGREMRTWVFDKIAGSDFERTKCGPKGGGQEARSNLSTPTKQQELVTRSWELGKTDCLILVPRTR